MSPSMKRITVFAIVGLVLIILVDAALETALALPRVAAQARELAAW